MFLKIKNIFVFSFLIVFVWLGWKGYNFFFDTRTPELQLIGLENNGYYCADIQCLTSVNKKGEMSVWLDNKPLISKFKINTANQEHPFTIPSRTVSNGKHTIKLSFIDNTFQKTKASIEREFFVDNVPLQAAFVQPETDYKVLQGRTLHLQMQVNKKIKKAKAVALSQEHPCFPESPSSSIYETFIPTTCEEIPNEYLVSIEIEDQVGNTLNLENKFQVVPYPFKKQTIRVSNEKLEKEKELGKSGKGLQGSLEKFTKNSPQEKLWRGAFCTPIEIAGTSCEFGTLRTTQKKGRYRHRAVDIYNSPKSVVWASQNGIVVMKERFDDSGNTVIVDHGWGVLSMYFHLDDFADIEVGTKVSQGNPIGTIGKTGYATGYHLHWELRVNNIPVDPMQWTKQTF